jgi:Domain of unknown function (DUF4037)
VTGFVSGLRLSGLYYEEAVSPLMESSFPGLRHSAALIGYGSEVLGYDAARSTDHEWGPRLLLFLSEENYPGYAGRVVETLRHELPREFRGYPTHFGEPDEEGVRLAEERSSGPVEHKVEVHTVGGFFSAWTGLDPFEDWAPAEWLCVPQQRLLELTAGRVYHEGLGELGEARARLGYYPRDVWLYLLAAQWGRVGQQEAFVGRTGEAGDEHGSRLVAASLVRDLMGLCFLMEKKYAPYAKWFGTAFSRLECAPRLGPVLDAVLNADSWKEREGRLSEAYGVVSRMHNALGVTPPLSTGISRYHSRPYLVVHAGRFAAALRSAIEDPEVLSVPHKAGSVDQICDSTDVLAHPGTYLKLRVLFE